MALDRFVRFLKGKGPKKAQVELVVRNFVGEAGEVSWKQDTLVVRLPGKPTHVFEGIEEDMMPRMRNTERWVEVYGHGSQVTITTRRADEFTNALADGLMKIFARYWEATEVDDGS